MNDNGFGLWESRAIITYLVDKYAKTDALYPKDAQKRAAINQRLQFDMSLYASIADYYFEQMREKKPGNADKLKKLEGNVEFLNTFLDGQTYVAGNTLSLADFSLTPTISTLEALSFDFSKYANVLRWFAHIKTVVPFELNEKSVSVMKERIKAYNSASSK